MYSLACDFDVFLLEWDHYLNVIELYLKQNT